MKVLELYREKSRDDGVRGELYDGDKVVCKMLELPWRDNQRGMSCIPPGRYKVDYLEKSASGKYRDVYYVKDVAHRSAILVHKGNWAGDESAGFKSDSDGCLLPCMGYTLGGEPHQTMGYDSKTALQSIHEVTGRQSFILEVYGV